jgi:hypothetical protein
MSLPLSYKIQSNSFNKSFESRALRRGAQLIVSVQRTYDKNENILCIANASPISDYCGPS